MSMDYCALSRPLHPNDADLQKKYTAEFRRTVWTLNRVMASCAACIALQATMLILNYATGAYLSVSSTGSIPTLLYYACYLWVPLWGIVLSLTFLSGARKKRSGSEAERTSDSSHTNLDDSTEDAALIISNAGTVSFLLYRRISLEHYHSPRSNTYILSNYPFSRLKNIFSVPYLSSINRPLCHMYSSRGYEPVDRR